MNAFSPEVFGADLAPILDCLLRIQALDAAGFVCAPLPLLSPFSKPVGNSWYEADMLTCHYYVCDISLRIAMQDPEIVAIFRGLTMLDVRRLLHTRWLAADHV